MNLVENIRKQFSKAVAGNIVTKLNDARDDLSRWEAHYGVAALEHNQNPTPETRTKLDRLYKARRVNEEILSELEAAMTAAQTKKAEGVHRKEVNDLKAKKVALDVIIEKMQALGEEADTILGRLAEVFDELDDQKTKAHMLTESPALRQHLNGAIGTWPLCIAHRLKKIGFKQPFLFDDEKARLKQYLPKPQFAQFLAGLSTRKR